jgi:hypothetical protein
LTRRGDSGLDVVMKKQFVASGVIVVALGAMAWMLLSQWRMDDSG